MNRWAFVLALILAPALRAYDWAPIPPATWSIQEDAKAGLQGAVILDDSTRYGVNDTEFSMRILILSEAGKAAAQFEPFSQGLYKLEGRTVYPDGRIVEFSQTKDFSEQTIQSNRFESKQKVVVPPGLTAHCVVDIHWVVRGSYLWGTRFTRGILRDYPVRHLVLRLTKLSPLGSVLLVPTVMKPGITDEDGYRVYTFSDLPALEAAPYSRWGLRAWPCLVSFEQPRPLREYLDGPIEAYWNKAAEICLKPVYTGLATGWKYKPFATEILKGLPDDPVEKASGILTRLNAHVRNTNWLTAEERASRTKSEDEQLIHAQDLSEGIKRGWTNGTGMFYLAYQLFHDAGLHPKLLMVANRDNWSFRYGLRDFFQFDDVLLGVNTSDGKGVAWLDPSNRFLPLGIIDPSYQGVLSLEVDTDSWTAKPYSVPSQGETSNQAHYVYDLKVDEDSSSFQLNVSLKGYEDYVARYNYYALSPDEAGAALKESWSQSLPGYKISEALVENASNASRPVTWTVAGSKDQDGGRRTLVSPFPGMKCPLWIPASWPDHRQDQVVMAYRSIWTADSTIRIPEGWTAQDVSPIQDACKFGQVSWTCAKGEDAGAQVVRVHYEVRVVSMFAAVSEVDALKSFLRDVEEGWDRRISLERSR